MAKEKSAKRPLPAAFLKKFNPSPDLAKVIGSEQVTRQEATKKIWQYVKSHGLQAGREINADDNLRPLFQKERIVMFEIAKILKVHLQAI